MKTTTILILTIAIKFVAATEIFYYADVDNDDSINKCALKAMNFIEEGTNEDCVTFRENPGEDSVIRIVQSSECAWQSSNRTIHLSPHCISERVCEEIVGKALGVDRPKHDIVHFVNQRFNCTGTCSLRCEHGGFLVKDQCACKCEYGFEGSRCEKLKRESLFTDASCGVIDAQDQGSLSLSTYPGDQQKTTFCQWLLRSDDPWAAIELNFDELNMDNEDLPPGHICNDILTVYGAGEPRSIACDGSTVSTMKTTSNWAMVELRTNPYSVSAFPGPVIRYNLHSMNKGSSIYADGMTASASLFSLTSAFSLIFSRFLL